MIHVHREGQACAGSRATNASCLIVGEVTGSSPTVMMLVSCFDGSDRRLHVCGKSRARVEPINIMPRLSSLLPARVR